MVMVSRGEPSCGLGGAGRSKASNALSSYGSVITSGAGNGLAPEVLYGGIWKLRWPRLASLLFQIKVGFDFPLR